MAATGESSLYSSSVRPYPPHDPTSHNNFIKFLNEQLGYDRTQRHDLPTSSSRLKRNHSSQALHGFDQSLRFTLTSKGDDSKDREQLAMENRRLKGEVDYLQQKSDELERKNEELFRNKSRAEIIERQYNSLQEEHERLKRRCTDGLCRQHIPLSLDHQLTRIQANYQPQDSRTPLKYESKLLRGREVSSRVIPNSNIKVNWKRVSAATPSYQMDNYQRQTYNRDYDDSLLESRLERSDLDSPQKEPSLYQYNDRRDPMKTIDLKEFSKLREADTRSRELQLQLKDLRLKNISLYRRSQEIEGEKIKFLEEINELRYEKARLQSLGQQRQDKSKKQMEQLQIQLESQKIRAMEFHQALQRSEEMVRLVRMEKEDAEDANAKGQKNREKQLIVQLDRKYSLLEEEFEQVRIKWMGLIKRCQQQQDQKKKLEKEIEEKTQAIAQLEVELARVTDKDRRDSEVNRYETSPVAEVLLGEQSRNYHYPSDLALQPNNNPNPNELSQLKTKQMSLLQQMSALRQQNRTQSQNMAKLARLFESEKQQRMKLLALSASWRQIERKARQMKKIDSAVDHLWAVKEVEYSNLHELLSQIKQL